MESFLDGMAYQCTKKGMTSDGIIIGGNWVIHSLIGEFWIAIRINHSNDRNSNRMSFSKRLSQSLDSNGKQKTWRTVTWSRRRRCLCLSWKIRRRRWMSSRSIRRGRNCAGGRSLRGNGYIVRSIGKGSCRSRLLISIESRLRTRESGCF